ncbi:MAG: copper resistance protein CopC [Gammaproteobacteria bacterium]|nr:copper resistance protein CopC [Gammaproteobacteria bacterium]MDD9897340.1 copper resistance protein CopC [Gammaproteobacteria bacterium]MDD9959965.1 copper resistance protein CopC [Gammaproteobacteria bacterium]
MTVAGRLISFLLISLLLIACATTSNHSPLLYAEPEIDGYLTRAPRTLRLYYSAFPDVSRSSLRLFGPDGEHQLRGLHTMAADDLMIEIMDPVSVGAYTVEWVTVVRDDPAVHTGSYSFSVIEN